MNHPFLRMANWTWRFGLFALALILVIVFLISVDSFVIDQRLYLLRTGNWEDLVLISLFAILIAYILKKLLFLQFEWGVKGGKK